MTPLWTRLVAKTGGEFAYSAAERSPVLVRDSGRAYGIESGVALCFLPHSTWARLWFHPTRLVPHLNKIRLASASVPSTLIPCDSAAFRSCLGWGSCC